jgi:hypothetical protein
MACSTARPSKETLEHWTMTDADRAMIAKLQEENKGPKIGTKYEVGQWDKDEAPARTPSSQTNLK